MSYVALDTDVVSKLIKRQLPATLLARLADRSPCVTFVTIAELTEWAIIRSWRQRSHAELDSWLAGVPTLEYDDEVARTWGSPSAAARQRGRPRPINDMWNAACCLSAAVPLATLNPKDYLDFRHEHGLQLLTS